MAKARGALPAPDTVVMEIPLTAGPPVAVARAGRPAAAFRIIRTTQVDEYERAPSIAAVAAAARPVGDKFAGKSRKKAKLSIADADFEEFDDIKDLVATLPTVKVMKKHKPKISTAETSDRVVEEKRNVRVKAFLYAASREDDNDYHLIVGRAPTRDPMYLTMEVSGLPSASSRHHATLKRVRDRYKTFFAGHPLALPGTSYDFYDPPIPIEVAGSLFYDRSHESGGRPGPQDLRPDMPTIWEIHPISELEFE